MRYKTEWVLDDGMLARDYCIRIYKIDVDYLLNEKNKQTKNQKKQQHN